MTTDNRNRPTALVSSAAIDTATPTEVANLVTDVRAQIGGTIRTLDWTARGKMRRQVDADLATTLVEIARRKLQAAAEAEIACFAQPLMAQRQVAAVHALRNDATMRKIVSMTQMEFEDQLLSIAREHEERIDRIASEWWAGIDAREAGGVIRSAVAQRRRAQLEERVQRMLEDAQQDLDRSIAGFRTQVQAQFTELNQKS